MSRRPFLRRINKTVPPYRESSQRLNNNSNNTMTELTQRSQNDALDTVFSALEISCCPSSYRPALTPDALDYVFDGVERVSCREEEGKEPEGTYRAIMSSPTTVLYRDNSLFEQEPPKRPVPEEPRPTQMTTYIRSAEKDAFDFIFENVERYACSEIPPDDQVTSRKTLTSPTTSPTTKATISTTKAIRPATNTKRASVVPKIDDNNPLFRGIHEKLSVIEDHPEEDEEILLYFRPRRTSTEERRRNRQQRQLLAEI